MTTPVEFLARRTVGTIVSVNPKEFSVLLDTDAPASMALNAGYPATFPRINGYVLVPNEIGAIVCLISWMGIENAPFPKRTGLKDFGLIDLPYPLRKLLVLPVATLRHSGKAEREFEVERGVRTFPTVGDSVVLPTKEELKQLVEGKGNDSRISIGTAPLAGGAKIGVDPDKLFGRHLAVLGNTGSGKSCSVSGLIRWAIEEADAVKRKKDQTPPVKPLSTRFVVLDPNGEYSKAFSDLPCKTKLFSVETTGTGAEPLVVPAWLWNSEEWTAFSRAQPGAQRPFLLQALRALRSGSKPTPDPLFQLRRFARGHRMAFSPWLAADASKMHFPETMSCGKRLQSMALDLKNFSETLTLEPKLKVAFDALGKTIVDLNTSHKDSKGYYSQFANVELGNIIDCIDAVLGLMPSEPEDTLDSADAPIWFDVRDLPDYLELVVGAEGSGGGAQFIPFLTMRIRTLLTDDRLRRIACPDKPNTLEEWLTAFLGNEDDTGVTVIDLSLVPSEVTHLVVAILARVIFEALQRYRRLNGVASPTVLVLEEAHTFVHRQRQTIEDSLGPEHMCRHTFEKIAREGRKFGLGLILASQRPAELSATVLAQCNTFLLHRIVNDEDQSLVRKLVPDNLGDLLRELPALPTQHAILLGWATPVPVLVEMKTLDKKHRPDSADPDFWATWTGEKEHKVNWNEIAGIWEGKSVPPETSA